MSLNPQISIILPTYNEESNIAGALINLLSQKTKYIYEIIVVDSSTDRTAEIIHSQFKQIKLIRCATQKTCGEGRNIGIEEARGDKILFTDADIRVPPDWVQRMGEHLEKYEMVGGSMANGTPKSIFGTIGYCLEFFRCIPRRDNLIPNPSYLVGGNSGYRKTVLETTTLISSNAGDDYLLSRALIRAGKTVIYDPGLSVVHLNREKLKGVLHHQKTLGEGAYCYRKKLGLIPTVITNFHFLIYFVPILIIPRIIFNILRSGDYLLMLYGIIFSPLLFAGNYFWAYGFHRAMRNK